MAWCALFPHVLAALLQKEAIQSLRLLASLHQGCKIHTIEVEASCVSAWTTLMPVRKGALGVGLFCLLHLGPDDFLLLLREQILLEVSPMLQACMALGFNHSESCFALLNSRPEALS